VRNTIIILIMLLTTLGPSFVVGIAAYAAIRAVGRNPSASARILLSMAMAFLFAEGIAIIALLLVFNLFK
jgi:F0F1-type ATP synthase membrane subunit c/vacuolar-type H+-ATPase subunit K